MAQARTESLVVSPPQGSRAWQGIALPADTWGRMLLVTWYARHIHGGVPQDEIAGLERNLEQWKF